MVTFESLILANYNNEQVNKELLLDGELTSI